MRGRLEEAVYLQRVQPDNPRHEVSPRSAGSFVRQLAIGPKTHDRSMDHSPNAGHVPLERFRG